MNTCLTDWLAFGNGSGNDAFDTSEQALGNKDVLCLSKKPTLEVSLRLRKFISNETNGVCGR